MARELHHRTTAGRRKLVRAACSSGEGTVACQVRWHNRMRGIVSLTPIRNSMTIAHMQVELAANDPDLEDELKQQLSPSSIVGLRVAWRACADGEVSLEFLAVICTDGRHLPLERRGAYME